MDKYYVSGVKADAEGNCEICADNEAHFFTLYERNDAGESQAIAGLDSRASAETIMAVYVERDSLQQQVNALAAEGVMMRQIIDSVTDLDNEPQYHDEGMGCGLEDRNITDRYEAMRHGWDAAMERVYGEVIPCAEELDSSATDAFIREIEARAVEKAAEDCYGAGYICETLHSYAAQLRAGEQGGEHVRN